MPQRAHRNAIHHRHQTGDVVLVGVREDHQINSPDAMLGETGEDGTGVGATVDQHDTTVVAEEDDRVALAHVEKHCGRRVRA